MDSREKRQMIETGRRLEAREEAPAPWTDPHADMTPEEKSKLIAYQSFLLEESHAKIDSLVEKIDSLLQRNDSLQNALDKTNGTLREVAEQLRKANADKAKAEKKAADLEAELAVYKKKAFGGKSQKGPGKGKNGGGAPRSGEAVAEVAPSVEEDKMGFDGSGQSVARTLEAIAEEAPAQAGAPAGQKEKELRLYRQGMSYRTMEADKTKRHPSDASKLPSGAKIIKRYKKYAYEQVSVIVEHEYETIRYKMPDGTICEGYFPAEGEPETIDLVPGTHAASSLMGYLAFNHFQLDTPIYREQMRIYREQMRILAEKMRVCRMTLHNWLHKGSIFAKEIVELLMDRAVQKGAIINCDETWCRVKVEDKYRKRYIWCLVNKKERIAIYRYEDGARSRDALKSMLGNREVKALQSDGYNVYMYIDKELVNTEHLCCMAHARAKFVYAWEQGGDEDAREFVDMIGELYGLEAQYEAALMTPEQVLLCRQSLKTKEIIGRIRSKLNAMLAEGHPPRGELMDKALRYMDTFWTQLFAYLKDGEFCIDNSIAERFLRTYSGERKNSLFYGSHKMARGSAVFHTLISTCRMMKVSALEYLKEFFRQIALGRRDFESLMPQTIGLAQSQY